MRIVIIQGQVCSPSGEAYGQGAEVQVPRQLDLPTARHLVLIGAAEWLGEAPVEAELQEPEAESPRRKRA